MQNKNSSPLHGGVFIRTYSRENRSSGTPVRFLPNLVLSGFLRQKVNAEALRASRNPSTHARSSLSRPVPRRSENIETDALPLDDDDDEVETRYVTGIVSGTG